jgi:hypothetical protein
VEYVTVACNQRLHHFPEVIWTAIITNIERKTLIGLSQNRIQRLGKKAAFKSRNYDGYLDAFRVQTR